MRSTCIAIVLLLLLVVEGFLLRDRPLRSHQFNNGQCLRQESIANQRTIHESSLQAAKKRYGFEVRQAKRQANRQKRKQRASRADKDDSVTIASSTNDSSARDGAETPTSSEKRVVRVVKWPFRKIRKVFSKSIFDLVEQ